ncbi:Panacea domain-containing protein [Campylobacter sp. RM12651]|uniref:Panacea domain-containing protein n=1 Tax=Campylobacter sp. RM12651 TaxID=1660079 RepID=UPI001EFAC5C1|nr:Panacea domain-containing protein [Campylobacter sp. RM12651]ULO03792.1 DUF4065 domain-containing protein [Campylobacter sp. RM12651]
MKAIDVAKHIIDMAQQESQSISHLKLQKILYFINLEYLKNNNCMLIDDTFQAWEYGAVISSIYELFKFNAAYDCKLDNYEIKNKDNLEILATLDGRIKELLKMKPYDLAKLSRREVGAWYKNYEKGKNNTIPLKDILEEARNIDKDNKCFHI